MNVQQKTPPKRPFLFKLLVLSLLIISLIGWMRFIQSLYQWSYLVDFNIQPGPVYTAITGIVIGLSAGIAAVILWLRLPGAIKFVQITIVLLTAGWWLDYVLFTHTGDAFTNLPFRVTTNGLYLAFVFLYFQYAPVIQRMRKQK
jgi:type III secretory pathway component EscS